MYIIPTSGWSIIPLTKLWAIRIWQRMCCKRCFYTMKELNEEGGIVARSERYKQNHRTLVDGMRALGFKTLLPDASQGPIITSFLYPTADFDFHSFYDQLKAKGFVIYPGKISDADTFRIGNIGDIFPDDMEALLQAIRSISY